MVFINKYKQQAEGIVESTHAKFVQGSIMKHVITMSITASIGLIALFFVDLIDFYFISLLWEKNLAAAVGYAGTVLFFTTSIGIGLMIAMWALVSKNIGAWNKKVAQRYAIYVLIMTLFLSIPLVGWVYFWAPGLLELLWAKGETLDLAVSYLRIVILWMPLMLAAMSLSAILRSLGEAKQAMYTTLSASIVNGVLDPIFIFTFAWWLEGAALATLASRFAMIGVTYYYVVHKNKFFEKLWGVSLQEFFEKLGAIMLIAFPAILTNLATPLWNAYVTKSIANFGDSAVAGMSMIGRISPVAFAVIFALSGAVWPIIGQNLGAKKYDRIRETVWSSMIFSWIYILGASFILLLWRDMIVEAFSLTGEARELGLLFMTFLTWLFIFQAMGFVANAVFNNIWQAKNSTIINFLKASIFTVPFVYYGAQYWQASGVIIGQNIGGIFIWIIALIWCLRSVKALEWK